MSEILKIGKNRKSLKAEMLNFAMNRIDLNRVDVIIMTGSTSKTSNWWSSDVTKPYIQNIQKGTVGL